MSLLGKRLLFWLPRLLGIAFAAFLGSFALDVFGEGYTFRQMILAFGIHLIPAAIIALALVLAWRFEWIGSAFFLALALFVWLTNAGRSHSASHAAALTLSIPLFVLAILFLANWLTRAQWHGRH